MTITVIVSKLSKERSKEGRKERRKGEKKEGRVADISIPLYSVTLGPAKCIVRQSSAEPATFPAILVL